MQKEGKITKTKSGSSSNGGTNPLGQRDGRCRGRPPRENSAVYLYYYSLPYSMTRPFQMV